MSNINKYLAQILSARFGKDVRQAIHDAIQQCYDDAAAGITPVITTQEVETGTEVTITVGANVQTFVVHNGMATTEEVETYVNAWLDTHPEATTTVADGAVTEAKLADDVKGKFSQLSSEIVETNSNINSFYSVETGKNLFNVATLIDGVELLDDNTFFENSVCGVSDYIEVIEGKTIYFSYNGYSLSAWSLFKVTEFDSSMNLIRNIWLTDAGATYTVPSGIKYVRLNIRTEFNKGELFQAEYDGITPWEPYKIITTLSATNIEDMNMRISLLEETIGENPLSKINDTPEMMSCFLNVGCIGDSLASGVAVYKDSSGNVVVNSQNRYEYSWGQYLARMTGNTYYNWSAGGMRTDSWLASGYATECFDGNHLCQAYIIGLAQNDNNANKEVGTSADIDISDYNNNADTFYGRYAKIIQKIKEINPKAKIFVITDPLEAVETAGYNEAIRTIADMFDSVYLMDMHRYWADAPCATLLANHKRYAHYNAVGYFLIAKMMMTYIDWIMQKNWEDFREIENIGTDWYYYE